MATARNNGFEPHEERGPKAFLFDETIAKKACIDYPTPSKYM